VRKGEDDELTIEDAQALASPSCTAADDVIGMDDPIIQLNVGNMLRKITQDSTSWKAIRFLESLEQMIRGFVLSVRFDSQGLPDAFMYMYLVQFGDVFFLDAQQRQFNSLGFLYISPGLHDDKGKIAQRAKFMAIGESHEVYVWILTEMARLEPRFCLDQIRIMFADIGITNSLLHKLSIHKTCLLRYDYRQNDGLSFHRGCAVLVCIVGCI
jgi:hypothetical protein